MHGIPGDILLGACCAVLAVFFAAMAWAGAMIDVIWPAETPEPEVPCRATRSPAPTAATEAS
jgi:hypothetical protein